MRVLIYEHFSGGGVAGMPLPTHTLCEGYGMLRGIVADFKSAGHDVSILLDSRIAKLNPPIEADTIKPTACSVETPSIFRNAAEEADATLVIGPESNHQLFKFVNIAENSEVTSLNTKSKTISKLSDKASTYSRLESVGLPVPRTLLVKDKSGSDDWANDVSSDLGFPFVVKPVRGEGCSGASLVKRSDQSFEALERVTHASNEKCFLAQEFIAGLAASVSLISNGKKAVPISLNWQDIRLGEPKVGSTYEGGSTPRLHVLKDEAFSLAEKAVTTFDLSGYVGVDIILTEDKVILMELNPRLTTSYIAAREVVKTNLAEALVSVACNRALPDKIQSDRCAVFAKVRAPHVIEGALTKIYQMPEAVSPPFPFEPDKSGTALVLSKGYIFNDASLKLREDAERLLQISCGTEQNW